MLLLNKLTANNNKITNNETLETREQNAMSKIDRQFRINEILSVIHRDIAGDLSVKALASKASYSEHYFHLNQVQF